MKATRQTSGSASHGTNPATAIQCGFFVDEIKADARGRVDMAELREKLAITDDIAGIMLTNFLRAVCLKQIYALSPI